MRIKLLILLVVMSQVLLSQIVRKVVIIDTTARWAPYGSGSDTTERWAPYGAGEDTAGRWAPAGPYPGLLAANNLNDVANKYTARANIDANKIAVCVNITSLTGTGVYRTTIPYSGTINSIRSVIDGALTVGDATITSAVNGVAVTGGVITIAYSGSAAGDWDWCVPSANNTVDGNSVLSFTVGGSNTANVGATITVLIETTYYEVP